MNSLRLHLLMICTTAALFLAALGINELLFQRFEFGPGINWVYLPAGIRLLCTLLFGASGAIGLLLVSWAACFFHFFPDDYMRAFMGGILASVAPYLVYLGMRRHWGLRASLTNLSSTRLLICSLAFAIASPLLHHLWFALVNPARPLLSSFLVMASGDFFGTLLVLYFARWLLTHLPLRR